MHFSVLVSAILGVNVKESASIFRSTKNHLTCILQISKGKYIDILSCMAFLQVKSLHKMKFKALLIL